jgi:hypothetical protein
MALFNKAASGNTRKRAILKCCFEKAQAFKNHDSSSAPAALLYPICGQYPVKRLG